MPEYRLTSRAQTDLAEIADYTIETFGIEQARRYRADFEALAKSLRLGQCGSWNRLETT